MQGPKAQEAHPPLPTLRLHHKEVTWGLQVGMREK
jgi:hypothetical protein